MERERRFLATRLPDQTPEGARRIRDRYIRGTRLRLRSMEELTSADPRASYKLTQKRPIRRSGAVQGLITNIYLSPDEYEVLKQLPAAALTKVRYAIPPMGVDVFEGPLQGLVIAEMEFASDLEAGAFTPPAYTVAEVTEDLRFTGGRLVSASREEVSTWLAEYGLKL